ncbi:polymer-forming cytoskeletal protein [Roseomonas sp. BN140053]|uniref:bactofilin family protein n=1 Tax=Roseomonas sp. BN140053 TaxID=3391898 RepID=UPI0039EA7B89
MSVFRRKRDETASPTAEAPPSAAVPVARDPDLSVPPFRPTAPTAGAAPKDHSTMSLPPKPSAAPGLPAGLSSGQPGIPARPQGGNAVPLAGAQPGAAPRSQAAERRTLVVGKGISLQGTVADAERLVVEGTVESQMIHAQELQITHAGVFKGEVEVEDAEVAGVFDGTITARGNLIIRATGRVLGVARCRRLQVEEGGQLSGRMEMLSDNASGGFQPAPAFPPHPDHDATEA